MENTNEEKDEILKIANISAEKSETLTNSYGGKATLYCKFTEKSTSTTNNTSTIDVSGYIKSTAGGFSGSANVTLKLYWHDNHDNTDKIIGTTTFKALNQGDTKSVNGTITVTHNDDGTLSGYAKIAFSGHSYSGTPAKTIQTANTNLTSFTRKTTIIDAFGWNQEEYQAPIGISIEPRIGSDTFAHTLTYSYNSVTGTLFSKKKLVRSTDSNDVIAVILDEATFNSYNQDSSHNAVLFPKTVQELASLIPNDKILPIKFTLETFNGDTSLGTSEITFNFEITGAKFDFNPTLQANDSLTKTLTGVTNKFIKGVSTVLASFGTAKSQNGATAKTYHYSNGNENYDLTTTSKVFSSVVNGNTDYFFAITDSRIFKTEYKSKKIGTDYPLLDYSAPIISKVTVQRTESLSKKVKIACEGTYWNKSFGSKTNSITLSVRYKLSGSLSWVTISSVTATVSGSKFSYSGQLPVDVATETGVEVEFTATDLCKAYSLKGSETKSTSIFDIGDDYFNINKELCNNYMPVPSYQTLSNNNIKLIDYNQSQIYLDSTDVKHNTELLSSILNTIGTNITNIQNKSVIDVRLTSHTDVTVASAWGNGNKIPLDNQAVKIGTKFSFSSNQIIVNTDKEIYVKVTANSMFQGTLEVIIANVTLNGSAKGSGYLYLRTAGSWGIINLSSIILKVKNGDTIGLNVGCGKASTTVKVGGSPYTNLVVEEL